MRFAATAITVSASLIASAAALPQLNFPSLGGLLPNPFPSPSGGLIDTGALLQQLSQQGLLNLQQYDLFQGNGFLGGLFGGCNFLNAKVRTEWRQMPTYQRQAFTNAVTCLHSKPSALNGNPAYPGVKSRYDDYAALHIESDRFVHFTATFLSWHRYVIWSFEKDLQQMCGYQGTLPYWDWGLDAQAPQNSSMFNGDPYSMGSNGAYVPRSDPIVFQVPLPPSVLSTFPTGVTNLTVPGGTGTGGGCLTSGPFSNLKANLGPNLLGAYVQPVGLVNPFAYNPRCIRRDINPWVSSRYVTYQNITDAITGYTTIENFQAKLQADSRYLFTKGDFSVHAGGHLTVGGDPFADQPSTPGDPLWFLHHAQIDRMWFIWQNQQLTSRLFAIFGTGTILNYPPSPPVQLTDIVDLKYVGGAGPQQVKSLLSTLNGPFCYKYQ